MNLQGVNAKKVFFGVLTAGGLLFLIFLYIFPFYWMLTTSFKGFWESIKMPPTLWPKTWSIAENYQDAWTLANFPHYLTNSVIVTCTFLIGQLLITIPAAYAFSKKRFLGKGFLFGFILFDMMIPGAITMVPIYILESQIGWMDTYWGLIVPFLASSSGVFLMTQAFKQVPDEIIDAARTDNSTEWQIMTRIMVPMCKPIIMVIGLLAFIGKWNDYKWTLWLTNTPAVRTLPFAVKNLFMAREGIFAWNVVMAGNILLVAPLMIIFLFTAGKIKQIFMYGGIK
jgi:ABC-type glycerol-3-phosphate transport system permease component